MKTPTVANHLRKFHSRIDDIYSSAEFYCPTHQELLETIRTKIHQDPVWGRLPYYAQSILREHVQARFEHIQRHLTIWLFPQPEGPALAWDEMPEDVRKTYCGPDKKGKHYWLRKAALQPNYARKAGARENNHLIVRYEITDKEW